MFEFLQQIDSQIYERYLTAEKNIKSASNSFYDSYLDLQESLLKFIVDKEGINIAPHESCGALLKRPEVKELFLGKYGLDSHAYDKMGDYAKKANDHKHKKEKAIVAETVVNYMRVFFDVSSCYARGKGLTVPSFNAKRFEEIFGSTDKIEERLEGIEEKIEAWPQKFLDALSKGTQSGQAAKNSNQNDGSSLKSFIARAEKEYNWLGTKKQFEKSKTILISILVALIAVGLISTVLSSVCFNIYSTFSLSENIVLLQAVILLGYTIKSKKHYRDEFLAKYTSDIFVLGGDGIWWYDNREKKRYKWLRRISYLAVACNIICIWTMGSGVIRIFATLFEFAFLGLTIASVFLRINHYCMYSVLFISGLNSFGTERVTLVHDIVQKKLYTLEDYKKTYADFI